MAPSTIAIIIMVLTLIAYVTNIIPAVLTTIISILAMHFTGILTAAQTMSGWGGTAAIMILGMNIVGGAFFTTGLSASIGRFLYKSAGGSEKGFLLTAMLLATVLALFINPMAIISIFMPIIDSVESQSGGKVNRKMLYLPVGIAAIYGGSLTAVSTSCAVTGNGLLEAASGQTFSLLHPAMLVGPGVIAEFVIMATFGYPLLKKCFNFESPALPVTATTGNGTSEQKLDKTKVAILVAVLIAAICCFAFTKLNMGIIALSAATILMVTGCISVKEAFSRVSWTTIALVAGGIAIGTGIQNSGAAEVLANGVIGAAGTSPYLLCVVVLVFSTILSNLMANTSTVVVTAPIAIGIAQAIGADILPFVLAAVVGSNFSVSTILSNASVAITAPAGYRFKDFFLWGGIVNLVAAILGVIALKIFFF